VVVVMVLYKVDKRYKVVTDGHEWSQMDFTIHGVYMEFRSQFTLMKNTPVLILSNVHYN